MANAYEKVTAQIVAELERGTVPWKRPWVASQGMHHNPLTGSIYRGANPLMLEIACLQHGYTDTRWVTMRQANTKGAKVRKGSHGVMLTFFKKRTVRDDADPDSKPKQIPMLRTFFVFNVADVDGLDLPALEKPEWDEPAFLEEAVEDAIRRDAVADFEQDGGGRASYDFRGDRIHVPNIGAFPTLAGWAETLLHEMGHSTGHQKRLARDTLGAPFGSQPYAREELVAELFACMALSRIGIDVPVENSAAYIASWLKALENDKHLVIWAAGRAQKAVDLFFGEQDRDAIAAAAEAVAA